MKSSSGNWTEDERRQFEEGVIAFGWSNWVQISKRIPTRSKNQVKSHAQKFSIHRKAEYAVLLQKHEAAMSEESNCGKKKKKTAVEKAAGAVSTPMKRNVRRSPRSSTKRDATTKSAAPTPVKVRRASKSSIATIDSGATVTPKPGLAKAKKPSKKTVKKPKKLGAQLMKFFTKSDTSKDSRFCAEQLRSTDNDSDIMEYDISKKDVADKTEVQVELKNSKIGDKHEMRRGRKSNPSFASLVTPNASMKSTVEEAQELMASLDYLDDLEDGPNRVEEDSFALALADDIFDIKLDEDITIPDVVDIAEGNSVARSPQQISSDALMHLRLQVQPNEGALDEIIAFLESHPDSYNVDSKSTLMRQRIIKLATEASNVGWWRESENLVPEVVRKAHLEHLIALTFAVLQSDDWKRFSEDNIPLQTQFNAQDEIRHICQLLSGIWNRVNHFLARDSYALFGAGVDQLERSHAVKGMVLMFDEILLHTE